MDEYAKKQRLARVRKAIETNNLHAVRFHNDGSGAEFEYYDPTGDHGCPCTFSTSLAIEEAIQVVSGIRFKLHEINNFKI